jgi:hypothetical protein
MPAEGVIEPPNLNLYISKWIEIKKYIKFERDTDGRGLSLLKYFGEGEQVIHFSNYNPLSEIKCDSFQDPTHQWQPVNLKEFQCKTVTSSFPVMLVRGVLQSKIKLVLNFAFIVGKDKLNGFWLWHLMEHIQNTM